MSAGGVDEPGGVCAQFIGQGHGFAGGLVVKAQNHDVGLLIETALSDGVFAQLGGNAQQLHGAFAQQALPDLQTCGAGFAVNEDVVHAKPYAAYGRH